MILQNLLIIIIIKLIKLLIYNESDKKKLETLNGMDLYEEIDIDSDTLII